MSDNSFKEALKFWVKLGFINFGGPAGQIAIMHREIVDVRKWISESAFMSALNFCMLLPGPEAHQLATYIGWKLHGYKGGIAAGVFFVLPSVFVMLFLSWIAVAHTDVPAISGFFYGITPVVVAIVAEAVIRIGKKALTHTSLYIFAAMSFIAGQFFSVPFPAIVFIAGVAGLMMGKRYEKVFCFRGHGSKECLMAEPESSQTKLPSLWHPVKMAFIFIIIWSAVVLPLIFSKGFGDVLAQQAVFFTKAAFVTFGGAYAVLSYISDHAVRVLGWLTEHQMLMGLGLAESTPGPLIMVTQYVGFLGAWKFSGASNPLAYGIAGGILTTFVTFLPSFFFIFSFAPYIELISSNKRIQAALIGITAAVVGVILKLAVFFSVKTFFPNDGFDIFAIVMAITSFIAIMRFHLSIHLVIFLGALAGMAYKLLL